MYYLFNGQLKDVNASDSLLQNRGFLYGDGFFESMRVYQGKILFEESHHLRLMHAATLLELDPDSLPDEEELRNQVKYLLAQNNIADHGRVRMSIYRKAGGTYEPITNGCGYVLQAHALDSAYQLPATGLNIGIFTRQAKAKGPFSNIKSLSSQLYVMAAIHAKKEKWNEALMLNTSGNIIEGITANVFVVVKDTVLTPPLSEGCVDGVFRKQLLNLLDRKGFPFREQVLSETEIRLATEIWFTNAVRGIQWTSELDGRRYENKLASEVFESFDFYDNL